MKWRRLCINAAMLLCAIHVNADDSIDTYQNHYEHHVQRMKSKWASLIPTTFVIQNAGNMGVASAGIGWSYGKRKQWESDLLFGYIPKHDSPRGKLTITFKGNYIPWNFDFSTVSTRIHEGRWHFAPLTTSLYINTVYGHEFWKSQPSRYPDKYYEFMSTKFRLNAAIGQRITFTIPENRRRRHSSVSLFYEVSTCDLYVRSVFQDSSIKLSDILGLSIGLKLFSM